MYSGSPSQQPFPVAPAGLCVRVMVCKFCKTNIPAVCSTGPMGAHELSLLCAVPLMLPMQPWELSVLASQSISIMVISGIWFLKGPSSPLQSSGWKGCACSHSRKMLFSKKTEQVPGCHSLRNLEESALWGVLPADTSHAVSFTRVIPLIYGHRLVFV